MCGVLCCLQSVIIFIYALVPWRSGQRQCDTPTTIGLGLRSCEATRVTWPHVNEGIGSCKLVLVCKMRITGGPGPGFAQQQQQQITSCILPPQSFPGLVWLWLVRTSWTLPWHAGTMVWALSPHYHLISKYLSSIDTLWTLSPYLYVWHYINKLDTTVTRGDHGVNIVSTPPPHHHLTSKYLYFMNPPNPLLLINIYWHYLNAW